MAIETSLILVIGMICLVPNISASEKKGVAVAANKYLCDDFTVLNNMTWWYDWRFDFWHYNKQTNCTINAYKATHVPMIWGWPRSSTSTWIRGDTLAVLGFNEPNMISQSNLTAQQAFDHWSALEGIAESTNPDKPLVSPAAAPCGMDSGDCIATVHDWFDEFFALCSNCKIDFLATHAYFCDAQATMSYLEGLYTAYGKNIWLTEFACPGQTDPAVQLQYMQAILPLLEEATYIERYAWFVARRTTDGFVKTSASLLEADTSVLTTLGQYYNDYV